MSPPKTEEPGGGSAPPAGFRADRFDGRIGVTLTSSSTEGLRTVGDERLRHLARHLHRLGPRPTFEFLREVAAGADLHERLERYARLDPAIVKYLGASKMLLEEEVQS